VIETNTLVIINIFIFIGLVFLTLKIWAQTQNLAKKESKNREILTKNKTYLTENQNLNTELLKQKIFLAKQSELQNQMYLEKISELSKTPIENLKTELRQKLETEIDLELIDLYAKKKKIIENETNTLATEILTLAIQRCSSEVANEHTIITIKLKDEDEKGKLIGKNGRNITWFEKILGVELIIDETPNLVTISGFNSIRMHLAKLTIEKLLKDGRVNPALIEEMYKKAVEETEEEILKAGQETVDALGIIDFDLKLIKLIGRLKFRTSYGQSILKHSLEMAKLAGLIVDSINIQYPVSNPIVDKMACVKGALLHDIGKAIDEEMNPKGNHIEIGEKICNMFGLDWKIKKCVSSHHTTGGDRQSYFNIEKNQLCLEAAIVDACDALSGARPGARKEMAESYFQRMTELENILKNVEGVEKSWIMKGAKEVWVFYDTNEIDSKNVGRKTKEIANLINHRVNSPQEIKIIGYREDKVIEYTR
jgi:ribonucrease Y